MRYKGFSVGGKHAKVYFGKGKNGCLPTILGFIVFMVVLGFIIEYKAQIKNIFLFLLIAVGVLSVIAVVALLIYKIVDKTKANRQEEEAETRVRRINIPEPEPSQWYFVLTGNEDADTQSALRDLRIRIELSTVPGKAQIRDEDGDITIVFNGLTLGRPEPEDAAWISEHFDSIIGIRWFYIRGGTLTADGGYCPFKVKVVTSLKPGCTPPPEGDFWIPPLLHDRYDIKGDAVVLASKTGKIHKPTGCGANRSSCTPMLYGEAVDNGFTECGSCFR